MISKVTDQTVAALQALVARSVQLREELAQTSAEVDKRGGDPAENLHRIWEAGMNRINVPQEYGGLSDGTLTFGFTAVAETLTNISAGESNTGQIYGTQALLVRELFNPHNDFPEATRRQLAHEILAENARFVASNAETGASGRVTSRKVDGGIVSTRLAAAHALQCEVARQVEVFEEGSDAAPLVAHAFRSKAASIEAALTTTSELYELTGARSTSNTYRLDRFWRSARTFSVHDPTDVKYLAVGSYELTGELPPLNPAQAGL